MPTASARTQTIVFTGDTTATQTNAAGSNPNSPGMNQLMSLVPGANTILVPAGGSTPVAVTIIPPAGNTVTLTLKGIAGDTGILLHLTDPCTISLGASVVNFVLNAAAAVTGIRFIWS
jgi:NADPH:quinone reductase-like Zn-dependent oxidoreductase